MIAAGPVEMFFRAISAGFLIAATVWLIPSAEGVQFHVITLMTWLIAISGIGGTALFALIAYAQVTREILVCS